MDIRTGEKVRRAMNFDRAEYGEIYHRTFGKGAGREACRQAWERWQEVQKVRASGLDVLTVHCSGTPVPAPHPNDYWAFAVLGPLRFLARINEAFLSDLPEKWLEFIRQEQVMKMLVTLGNNPRAHVPLCRIHWSMVLSWIPCSVRRWQAPLPGCFRTCRCRLS
jgi:hypothetical protein